MRIVFVLAALCAAAYAQTAPEGRYLQNLKKLTDGGSNAEAYWSPDGKRIVYAHVPQFTEGVVNIYALWTIGADGSGPRQLFKSNFTKKILS